MESSTDWGVSIKSKKAVRGGEAVEITLEVSYDYLGRAIEKLSATPFAAYVPSIGKVITFLKSLYVDEEIPPPDDLGEVGETETEPEQEKPGTGWPIAPKAG